MKKQSWSGIQHRRSGIILGAMGLFLDIHIQGITLGTRFTDIVGISNSVSMTDVNSNVPFHSLNNSSTSERLHTIIPLDEMLIPSPLHQIPDFFLPRYPSFNSQLLDQQLVLYSLHLFLSGPPDVLIVGSSRAIQGVDPEALKRSLQEQGYPALKIYNFSINGATAQVIDLLLTKILDQDQLPSLIIWADGVRAFNSGRPDRTYEQIVDSDGFQQLEDGMHPILSRPPLPGPPSICQDNIDRTLNVLHLPNTPSMSALFRRKQTDTSSPTNRLREFNTVAIAPSFSKSSPSSCPLQLPIAIAHQTSLQSFPKSLLLHDHILFHPNYSRSDSTLSHWPIINNNNTLSSTFDTILYQHTTIEQVITSLPFDLDATGFLPNSTEFNPVAYYQTYPYVAGEYDTNYVPFSLQGDQLNATVNIAQHLHSKGINLVIVNLPLTVVYLDATRSRYEDEFRQYMQQLSLKLGFKFLNLNQTHLEKNQYFADPSHLNAIGARAVANQIALQPDIPWPFPSP